MAASRLMRAPCRSRGGALRRATGPRFLRCWNEKIGGHPKTGSQPLDHPHAQFFLAAKHFTHAAWRAEDRHHVGTRDAVLIHQITNQRRGSRWPARPLSLLISFNQASLRLEARDVGRVIRVPESIDQ